jgi:flagellar biosynthetic protein FliP
MADATKIIEHVTQSGTFQNLSSPVQTALILGALVLIPSLLVCVTGFTRIAIVLSFARKAVTAQDIPPNSVLLGLSLFLTLFVMGPTFEEINQNAVTPYIDGKIAGAQAWTAGSESLKNFMLHQTRRQDLALFIHMAKIDPPEDPAATPMHVLVPAFVISELKTAFIMGFCIYLPFLLVDLVVASVLTSMGMMMMPPVVVSAPFKILLFILADGWHLVARALSLSFG